MGYYGNKKWRAKVDNEANRIADLEVATSRPGIYGVCSKCQYMRHRKAKYYDTIAWCAMDEDLYRIHELRPNTTDPIVECSQFYPVGQLSIESMAGIATIITVGRSIGFNCEPEVTIMTADKMDELEKTSKEGDDNDE